MSRFPESVKGPAGHVGHQAEQADPGRADEDEASQRLGAPTLGPERLRLGHEGVVESGGQHEREDGQQRQRSGVVGACWDNGRVAKQRERRHDERVHVGRVGGDMEGRHDQIPREDQEAQ